MDMFEKAIKRATVLPCFQNPSNIETLKGGMSNVSLLVTDGGKKYVARFVEDVPAHNIMRWNELAIHQTAAQIGISPAIKYYGEGVMVMDFIDGTALIDEDLHAADTIIATTKFVRRVHDEMLVNHQGSVMAFWAFHAIRNYQNVLHEKHSPYLDDLPDLLCALDPIEQAVGKVHLALTHNDLLAANILRTGAGETTRLWLIDWEYSGLNSPLFDLGGLGGNNLLPFEIEALMLKTYFGEPPDKALWRRYYAMKCASLIREILWSMVADLVLEVKTDHKAYIEKNIARYHNALEQFHSFA